MKRGDKVKFKGNSYYSELPETYIWAVSEHLGTMYIIQHPDGGYTKEEFAYNSGLGDGFETPHSSNFQEGLHYIWVTQNEIEKIN